MNRKSSQTPRKPDREKRASALKRLEALIPDDVRRNLDAARTTDLRPDATGAKARTMSRLHD